MESICWCSRCSRGSGSMTSSVLPENRVMYPGRSSRWFQFICVVVVIANVAVFPVSATRSRRRTPEPDTVVHGNSGSRPLTCNTTFSPEEISIEEKRTSLVNCSMTCLKTDDIGKTNATLVGVRIYVWIMDLSVAVIEGTSDFNSSLVKYEDIDAQIGQAVFADGSFNIRGLSFGKTTIQLNVTPLYGSDYVMEESDVIIHDIVVIKGNRLINMIYLVILGIMIVMYNFGFGCKIEWPLIVAIVKKPVAPAIGLCCQFLVMAPVSFGMAKLLGMSDEAGLGLLAIGASPGGGGSNVFSYLLKGDLELSITMSFFSTVASLGMTPLWIWGLGRYFMTSNPKIKIPVTSVFSSLAIVTLPVIVGLIVRRFKPGAAKKIAWCLKPFTGVVGAVFLSMGVYVYYSALIKVTWPILVGCIVVSAIGYMVGAIMGKIFRQPRPRWVTISLETGFQNLALSLMIIGTSLEQPESDLAGVVPICYTFLSASIPTLIFIVTFFYRIHKGEKPWKKTETLDLSPLHKPPKDDTPNNGGHDLPIDAQGITCTAASGRWDLGKTDPDIISDKPETNGIMPNGTAVWDTSFASDMDPIPKSTEPKDAVKL